MAVYLLLTSLTEEGRKTIENFPERLKELNKEVEYMGVKIRDQYALLGQYDFVNIVEAPSDEIVAKLGARYTMTFYTTQSTATSYACDVYTNDQGYDAYSGAVGDGVGQKVNTAATQMTNSIRAYSTAGLFDYIWISCPTNNAAGGTSVTVTMLSCPLSR